jgi:hypothetical protein
MSQSLLPRNALWLLLPPIALCSLDLGLTFYGQPVEYWAGNYAAVQEVSPSFAYYMSIHPLVCLAVDLLWISIFSLAILLLPEKLALTVAVAVMLGHLAGAASWLIYRFKGYQYCNALFLATAALIVFAFKRGQRDDGRSAIDWERTGLPGWMRWVVIAALFVLPTWWFLIPR